MTVLPYINGVYTNTNGVVCVAQNTDVVWWIGPAAVGQFFDAQFPSPSPFSNEPTFSGDANNVVSSTADTSGCFTFAVTSCDMTGATCGTTDPRVVVTGSGGVTWKRHKSQQIPKGHTPAKAKPTQQQ